MNGMSERKPLEHGRLEVASKQTERLVRNSGFYERGCDELAAHGRE